MENIERIQKFDLCYAAMQFILNTALNTCFTLRIFCSLDDSFRHIPLINENVCKKTTISLESALPTTLILSL